jgi:hypothetical protein
VTVARPVRELLPFIVPSHFEAYLRTHNWQLFDSEERYTLWSSNKSADREVLVPLNRNYADYVRRLAEAVKSLEDVEERPAALIVQDLISAPFDIIRLRAEEETDITGSITLNGGVDFIRGAKDLFLAATCAAWERRAYFPSRKPREAEELIAASRLGQTERGSFIVTIYVPVAVIQGSQVTMEGVFREPFARRATKTLLGAVSAAIMAAEASKREEALAPFWGAVGSGVSANLCEALVDIHASTHAPALDLAVRWAFTAPAPVGVGPTVVRADQISALSDAGRFFRKVEPPRDTIVSGKVVRLERDEEMPGRIAIKAVIGGKTRRVRLVLSGDDYHNALDAHDKDLPVLVQGDLMLEGRSYELVSPRGFRVVRGLFGE